MPIKIKHGPPGSYKTSSAVQDDLIRYVEEGRLIYTNVRGITLERMKKAGVRVPDGYDRFFQAEMESSEDVERWRWFFAWAEPGAFFLLDEAQIIFPAERFKTKDITLDKVPPHIGEIEKQISVSDKLKSRPMDLAIAFEMHRHYNWDFTFTMPNIRQLNGHVRGCAETAYKLRNQAMVGGALMKGRFLEIFHEAGNSGESASHEISKVQRKIDKRTFDCYESTATGVATDTEAGISLFKNPKVLFVLLIVSSALLYLFLNDNSVKMAQKYGLVDKPAAAETGSLPHPAPDRKRNPEVSDVHSSHVDNKQSNPVPAPVVTEPYKEILFTGYSQIGIKTKTFVAVSQDGKNFRSVSGELLRLNGYEYELLPERILRLKFKKNDNERFLPLTEPPEPEERSLLSKVIR